MTAPASKRKGGWRGRGGGKRRKGGNLAVQAAEKKTGGKGK